MEILAIFFFALAVSVDGFMVGLAYGIKKIRIPMVSLIVIALASSLAVIVSMAFGKGLALLIPAPWTAALGSLILIVIGFYFLWGAFKEKVASLSAEVEKPLVSLNIRSLGIIIKIIKEPSQADFDASGIISAKEAFFLGLALALDALGAGIGLAMSGFNIVVTALSVGVLKFILVNSGIFLGNIVKNSRIKVISALIPGLIFITIGLLKYI